MTEEKRKYHAIRALTIAGALLCAAVVAGAMEYTWTGDAGDFKWNTPGNWSTGGVACAEAPVNATNIVAVFDTGAAEPWTLEFDTHVTNAAMVLRNDNIVFDLRGNTYSMVSPYHYIASAAGQTGVLKVVNGELFSERNLDNVGETPYFYIGNGSGAFGSLTVSGTNAVFRNSTRVNFAQSSTSEGEFILEDGATAYFGSRGTQNFTVGASGKARLVVSNANLRHGFTLGSSKGSFGEAVIKGTNTDWYADGNVYVGTSGTGVLTVDPGIVVVPGRFYMYAGGAATSTGVVNFTSCSVGVTAGGNATAMQFSLGYNGFLKPGEAMPNGGEGTLNMLDGAVFKGTGTSAGNKIFFYVGPRSRIRIRDSEISWCATGDNKNQPFLFREGSFLTVELTDRTAEFCRSAPLLFSGATVADMSTNRIDGAILELELTESYEHIAGDEFRLIGYEGVMEGEFAGLPDGSDFYIGNRRFSIDYGPRDEPGEIVVTARAPLGALILIR